MKHHDSSLDEFFQAERARDHREAPSFREMTESLPEPEAPAKQWAWLPLAAALFACVAAGGAWFLRTPIEVEQIAAVPEAFELDALCDSALSALTVGEEEAQMRAATDSLLVTEPF
ncbi:hypothetical protein Poly30_11510 [Planctomycetes bacterium Poly30]|uniref:Uncharacterized protein n=1 Tax=Saltatorellus ferox TaxID=2528018 RepID=A0A518ENI7_9BACT|nr:hypothetical protein Poly30_11510 [Planctomycetes bacterium Poly30]